MDDNLKWNSNRPFELYQNHQLKCIPCINFFFFEPLNFRRLQNGPKIQRDEVEYLLAKPQYLIIIIKNRIMLLPACFNSDTIPPLSFIPISS